MMPAAQGRASVREDGGNVAVALVVTLTVGAVAGTSHEPHLHSEPYVKVVSTGVLPWSVGSVCMLPITV
jgi:hypothetical protein